MKVEPTDVGYRQDGMGWVWYDSKRKKEHQGNKFVKEEEFNLNQNSQTEICIKQLDMQGLQCRRE